MEGSTVISVEVGPNEFIKYTFHVDTETGLDVDPATGLLRTREETIANVREVYQVGKEALGSDLERYNKWLQQNPDKEKKLFGRISAEQQPTRSDERAATSLRPSAIRDLSAEADVLRLRGNEALTRGEPLIAERRYTEAIALDDSLAALWANRAEARLRLKQYPAALADGVAALARLGEGDLKGREKPRYRVAMALRGLNRIDDALKYAEMGAADYPTASHWHALVTELASTPRLVLSCLGEPGARVVGSRGICALRCGRSVSQSDIAEGVEIGRLQALFSWKADRAAAALPTVWSRTQGSRLRAVCGMLLKIADGSGAPIVSTVTQFSELLGATMDVGNLSGHDFELVALAEDLAATVSSGELDDALASAVGTTVADVRSRFVAVGWVSVESIAVTLLHLACLTTDLADALWVEEAGMEELFVVQHAFLLPHSNPVLAKYLTSPPAFACPFLVVTAHSNVDAQGAGWMALRASAMPHWDPSERGACAPWLCLSAAGQHPEKVFGDTPLWYGTA